MKVSLTLEAEQELIEGARFYAHEAGSRFGHAFIAEFERSVELIRVHPSLGTIWRGTTRRFPLRRFPYSIVYQVQNSELRVLAIAHQRRKPGFWKSRA